MRKTFEKIGEENEYFKKKIKTEQFHKFVKSVLLQIATAENKDIFFEYKAPKGNSYFDAYAPHGIGEIDGPVIFEITKSINKGKLDRILNRLNNDIDNQRKTIIVITNEYVDAEIKYDLIFENEINGIKIYDKTKIDEWIQEFPFEYTNVLEPNEISQEVIECVSADNENLEQKSHNNLTSLLKLFSSNENMALVLGAGISVQPGAKTWNELLELFENHMQIKGRVKDCNQLCAKLGDSNLSKAQIYKNLFKNEDDYYWLIHQGLYKNMRAKDITFTIYQVARIIKKYKEKKRFKVLNYNFDGYLEDYLDLCTTQYRILYNENCALDENVPIYHVHGFLPRVSSKSKMEEEHKKSVYLTESDYNRLYNQPYSWSISSQLSFFRENICLFIGCSLTDPNIRRLLEIAKNKNQKHYAIFAKDRMSITDLIVASNHFARLGIEIIWVNDYSEITTILSRV